MSRNKEQKPRDRDFESLLNGIDSNCAYIAKGIGHIVYLQECLDREVSMMRLKMENLELLKIKLKKVLSEEQNDRE